MYGSSQRVDIKVAENYTRKLGFIDVWRPDRHKLGIIDALAEIGTDTKRPKHMLH